MSPRPTPPELSPSNTAESPGAAAQHSKNHGKMHGLSWETWETYDAMSGLFFRDFMLFMMVQWWFNERNLGKW